MKKQYPHSYEELLKQEKHDYFIIWSLTMLCIAATALVFIYCSKG